MILAKKRTNFNSNSINKTYRHCASRWYFQAIKKILLCFLLITFHSTSLCATECADRPECWPSGSSMNVGLRYLERKDVAERRLFGEYEILLKLFDSSLSEEFEINQKLVHALKEQQQAWLQYRTAECELIGALTGAGGTWPSTYASKCESNQTEQRLLRVRSAIRCIKRMPKQKREFAQNRCLQQLAPLTNK